jgi:hypothetical protein
MFTCLSNERGFCRVTIETITDREELLIRRLALEPGERTRWHADSCQRFTVVIRGSRLAIEFKDDASLVEVEVQAGLADWEGPEPRVHRATNMGPDLYEEIVTFYRESAEIDPQPEFP